MSANSTPSTPSLVSLAEEILQNANALQDGLPTQPSFQADGRQNYHDVLPNPVVMGARTRLIEAAKSILSLALGPTDVLRSIITTDRTGVVVLRVIHELGIANAVPRNGSISIASLASALDVHPEPLRRILGFAYTMQIFCQPKPDLVSHTSISAAIPTFDPYIWLHLSETTKVYSSSFRFAEAMKSWPAAPISVMDANDRDFWTILEQDDPQGDGMAKFSKAMKTQMDSLNGPGNRPLTDNFDWAGLGPNATVIDVGGGNGHNAIHLANAFPNLLIEVQDLPKNEEPARVLIENAGLAQRVTFRPHDFFKPQPGELCPKAFLLSRILHDWPEKECQQILSNLVPVMKRTGAKLILVERVLPDRRGDMALHQEAQIRSLDLLMYTTFGASCERSGSDWTRLLESVDPDLTVRKVTRLEGSELSILDVGI